MQSVLFDLQKYMHIIYTLYCEVVEKNIDVGGGSFILDIV